LDIHGDTSGLAPVERKALERIYRRRVPPDTLTSPELTRSLCEVSHATRRQVGALVDRSGIVQYVVIGDSAKLMLPDLGRFRAGASRFRGLRLIHTHLRGEPLTRDDIVDLTRLRLDMIASICVSTEGLPSTASYAHCVPVPEGSGQDPYRTYGPMPYARLDCDPSALIAALEEEFARSSKARSVRGKDGRAILVHVCSGKEAHAAQASLTELRELARTAGVEVADTVLQVRPHPDPRYVLGRGKLEETVLRALQLDADVLVFDRELSAAQGSGIAAMTDLRVLDRTQLILDIFAQRAESVDGKLQVELAQTRYLLPRLGTKDDALSRLTGGIGGRGPGETKLEIGRRRARERIQQLEERLKTVQKQRKQRRARRERRDVPVVAIVGYTNAGKSTLLNALTGASVLAENKLFATLDPTSRRMHVPVSEANLAEGWDPDGSAGRAGRARALPGEKARDVVVTDTVGFIRDLPKDLFAAFRATFEEAAGADLLLQVVDVSDPACEEHLQTTDKLLEALELGTLPRLRVFNKVDLVAGEEAAHIAARHEGVLACARDPLSVSTLREAIGARLSALEEEARHQAEREPDELAG
jgi:GTP-binding protein HflX